MTIRTPRRRISPRTKQRYRAVRDFLRKALGTSSQPDIKTNSSIAVSVSDLKDKIIGIEEQLHKVSKHCRDLSCLEHNFRKKSLNQSLKDESINIAQKSSEYLKGTETKALYKPSNDQCNKCDKNNILTAHNQDDKNNMMSNTHGHAINYSNFEENVKDYNFNYSNRRAQFKYKKAASIYSTSSFHSLIETKHKPYSRVNYSGLRKEKRHLRKEFIEPLALNDQRNREKLKKDLKLQDKTYEGQVRTRKSKREHLSLDQDFIADIIKKQYKPVKLFGRRDSDFSQFSAPVCHDQEFKIREDTYEDCDVCSCCFEGHRHRRRHIRNSDLSDIKSICDARLYGSKKHRRHKYGRGCIDDYNNSTYYDVVPVKEKSSPKSRRKFAEDNVTAYQYCREVPPSPRSNRPRLNLKAQHHTEYVENSDYDKRRSRKNSPSRPRRRETRNVYETDMSSDSFQHKRPNENITNGKLQKPPLVQEDVGTMSSLQYPNFMNEQNNLSNNDTTINTQVTDSLADKTDKTLSEIKDILQSFLHEIKKESTHGGQSDVSSKIDEKHLNENQDNNKINTMIPNSGHSFNNYGVGQCGVPPFVPAFTNPCCYPVMPMCPMNCLQNGYVIPTPSYTCNVCSKNSKPFCTEKDYCNSKNKTEAVNTNNETQELIKEIYKFVSQNKKSPRNTEHCAESITNAKYDRLEKKILTSRSVGGSTKASRHDANVGTPNLKCQSKSCEAIGCRINSESFNTTNASYSDTILEKLSLEATQSSTESDVSTDIPTRKNKQGKLKKVLKSLKLFKKKHKRDVIEEESESESTVEVDVKPKSPFRQHITNYAMHGQEYFQPPPVPQPHCCSHHLHEQPYDHGYDPRSHYLQSPTDIYNHHTHHTNDPRYTRPQHATQPCPNHDPHFNHVPPQVPLCLKEVEVKSIGTQSVRKMTILQKLTTKSQTPQQPVQLPISTTPVKEKFNFWKSLQEKAKQNNPDPMDFSLKTQKELAQGDIKMRNAMLKKLFYKRNPFSPRNLIIKTILGRDKSSFGEPPKMYRPRMFL